MLLRSVFRKQCRWSRANYVSDTPRNYFGAICDVEIRQSSSSSSGRTSTSSALSRSSEDAAGLLVAATAALMVFAAPLGGLCSDVNTSCAGNHDIHRGHISTESEAECTNDDDIPRPCNLHWVTDSESTKAECTVHQVHGGSTAAAAPYSSAMPQGGSFDPTLSRYYDVRLTGRAQYAKVEDSDLSTPLLHNTIVVLPNLISSTECELLVNEAERILRENKASNVQGCRTESWSLYSRFDKDCQDVMDRVLGQHVLAFIRQRLPKVAKQLFDSNTRNMPQGERKEDKDGSAKDKMACYWDDPVVIKYKAGNELAPHEDMRELTIVVPLNPLGDFPLTGGGTRFWLETISPEYADSNGGISLKPAAGTGILFNGNITHSGNAVHAGTRFVLMTSITLDEEEEEEDEEDE